jgi:type I restriction enzyme S subunit
MPENTRIPAIRFAGFTDAWEQRKLGELGSVAMCRRIFKEQTTEAGDVPFYKIGTFGDEPDAFISRELFEEYKSKYPHPEVGDILISASGSIGRTVEYTGEDEYFQDSNIVWLQHDARLDNSFLKHFYSMVKWHGLEGSTIKRLYNKNILDTRINVPLPDEQKAVGSFFDHLNDLITLHQREYDKTVNIKKAMLEKMFPKNGADIPEIRFKGFTDAWEQRKLSDYMDFSNGINAPKENYGKGRKMISVLDILDKQPIYYNTIRNSVEIDETTEKRSKVEEGDLVFVRSSEIPEEVGWAKAYLDSEYALFSGFSIRGKKKSDFNAHFFELSLNSSNRKQIERKAGGSTRFNVSQAILNSILIDVPSLDEQIQIDEFFTALDHLITLHQRELKKLQNMKKALLEKMFV